MIIEDVWIDLGDGAVVMLLSKSCQQKLQDHITGCHDLADIRPVHCKTQAKQMLKPTLHISTSRDIS